MDSAFSGESSLLLVSIGLLAIKATLVFSIGWLLSATLRRVGAAVRHLVWLCVIVGALLVPIASRIASFSLPILPSPERAIPAASSDVAGSATVAAPIAIAPQVSRPVLDATTLPRHQSTAGIGLETIIAIVWGCGVAALVGWLIAGALMGRRIVRRARPLASAEWTRLLADAAARLGIDEVPALFASREVDTAFTCRVVAPVIVLPADAEQWPSERRSTVLLHELSHVRRRDLVAHLISRVVCALYWFHPLAWSAARRMRAESELACDDLVIESGVRRSDYAQHLLEMAAALRPGYAAPMAALPIVRRTEFEGRLIAVLDSRVGRHSMGRTQIGALIGVIAVMVLSISAIAPVKRAPVIDSAPISTSMTAAAPSIAILHDRTRARLAVHVAPPMTESAPFADRGSSRSSESVASIESKSIVALAQYGTQAVANPLVMILREADALELTAEQADSIAMLNREYSARIDSIWSSIARYYHDPRRRELDASAGAASRDFAAAESLTAALLARTAPIIAGLLTPEQRQRVPARLGAYLDSTQLGAGPAVIDPTLSSGSRGRIGGPGR